MGELIKTRRRTNRSPAARERQELLDMIREQPDVPDDYHPLIELARMANSNRLPLNLKLRAHTELAQYLEPKVRPIDQQEDEDGPKVPKLEFVQTVETIDGVVIEQDVDIDVHPDAVAEIAAKE